MPWTVAVVDLRTVFLPDPAGRPRLLLKPPSCQQADGARRSHFTRAPLERPVAAAYSRVRRAMCRVPEHADASVRAL